MKKTIAMEYGKNTTVVCYEVENGMEESMLHIVPLFNCKPYGEAIERSGLKFDIEKKEKELILTPSEKDLKALAGHNGKDVYLGIRSERFVSGENKEQFECTIDVIEVLGKEKTLFVKLKSGKDLVITVPGHHDYESGEKHVFGFDLEALHFFDAETEERIN